MSTTKPEFWTPLLASVLLASVLLTLVLYFLGAVYSGGGHSLSAMVIFFPYGVMLGQRLEDTSWEFVAAVALLLQFPLYVLLLAWAKGKLRIGLFFILLVMHSLGVVIGLRVERARQERYSISEVCVVPRTAPANNGMHPTALSLAFINLASCDVDCAVASGGG